MGGGFTDLMPNTITPVWVDLDMVSLHPNFDFSNLPFLFVSETDKYSNFARITTCVLKLPRASSFGERLIQETKRVINGRKHVPWGCIGPDFLDRMVRSFGLQHFTLAWQESSQIPYFEAERFIIGNTSLDSSRPLLHLYLEMWRQNCFNKRYFYKTGVVGELLQKYHVYEFAMRIGLENYDKEFSFMLSELSRKNHEIYCRLRLLLSMIRRPKRLFSLLKAQNPLQERPSSICEVRDLKP